MKKNILLLFLLLLSSNLFAQAFLGHNQSYINAKVPLTGSGTNAGGHAFKTGNNNLGQLTYYFNSNDICFHCQLFAEEAIGRSLTNYFADHHYSHPTNRIWAYKDEFDRIVYITETPEANSHVIIDYSYQKPTSL